MFRRRERASGTVPITMLSDYQREQVGDWWKLASDRIDAGPRETSPLSASLMLEMTLGYAVNSGSRVPPLAYAFATRVGYALRMYVDTLAPPQPLDVSSIDLTVITT